MLADFSSVNIAASSAVWRAKKSPSAVLLGRGEAEVRMFRWEQEKKFTVLEDFVLKVIERGLGNSDEEIARVLCLEAKDIAVIVKDGMLNGEIEGDASHRSLPKEFTRQAPDGIALETGGKPPPREIEGEDSARAGVIELADTFGRFVKPNDLPKKRKEWAAKKTRARLFALPVEAFRYKDNAWVFLCGGQLVPVVLNDSLSKLDAFKNIGEKTAPSNAVCHRDEFWPWLAHRLRKTPPERVDFECAERDEQAMEWLRKEAGISAEALHHRENTGRESVSLDGERFELHGNFVCRAKKPS